MAGGRTDIHLSEPGSDSRGFDAGTGAVMNDLIAALDVKRGRGPRVRVERRDGTVVEGELADATSDQMTVFVDRAERLTVVPFNTVQTLAVAEVPRRRYAAYVGVAGLTGASVFASANRWAPDEFSTIGALALSAALAVLLAGRVIQPLHRRLVSWRVILEADGQRGNSVPHVPGDSSDHP